MSSSLALDHLASGKVRELYDAGDGRLLLVASRPHLRVRRRPADADPRQGPRADRALAVLVRADGRHRRATTSSRPGVDDFPEGARDPELAGRAMLVRRLEMLPLECVVRGYLAGSGWKDYGRTGAVCGIPLPGGLREADRLPRRSSRRRPRRRPGTTRTSRPSRASSSSASSATARSSAPRSRSTSARPHAALERGHHPRRHEVRVRASTRDGALVLGDEVLTPDSSRFWPADSYAPGASPPSFDKQFVRDWLETQPWDKTAPGPGAARRGARRHRRALPRGLRATRRASVRELPRRDGGERA